MNLFDTIERKFLFSLTRGLAMALIALLVVVLIGGAVFVGSQFKGESTNVSPNEVVAGIQPPPQISANQPGAPTPTPAKADLDLLPGIKLPFVLQKHFSTAENIRILNSWISGLSRDVRQQFVDEMAAAVLESEKRQLDGAAAINKYKQLKLDKIADAGAAATIQEQRRIYYAAAAFSSVLLVALLSLILVLLAIERNTRKGVIHETNG